MAILIERGYLEGLTLNEMIHSLFHFLETSHGQLPDYRFVWRNLTNFVEYDVSVTVPNRVALMQGMFATKSGLLWVYQENVEPVGKGGGAARNGPKVSRE